MAGEQAAFSAIPLKKTGKMFYFDLNILLSLLSGGLKIPSPGLSRKTLPPPLAGCATKDFDAY
ncbi:hypothetical protein LLH00_16955 [bacterium]|nr:hypothetical protein [bacterium]